MKNSIFGNFRAIFLVENKNLNSLKNVVFRKIQF